MNCRSESESKRFEIAARSYTGATMRYVRYICWHYSMQIIMLLCASALSTPRRSTRFHLTHGRAHWWWWWCTVRAHIITESGKPLRWLGRMYLRVCALFFVILFVERSRAYIHDQGAAASSKREPARERRHVCVYVVLDISGM